MARLNIGYDLLTYEGDILRLHFWAHAFEVLKAQGRRLPADRRQAGRLLGDAHRGRRRRAGARPNRPTGDARPTKAMKRARR